MRTGGAQWLPPTFARRDSAIQRGWGVAGLVELVGHRGMEIDLNKDTQSNLVLFEEISSAKFRFFDAIAASRQRGSAVKVADLRQDYLLEIAKFYYLLKLCKIDSPKKLREFAIFHNRKIEALIKTRGNKPKEGPHRDPKRTYS